MTFNKNPHHNPSELEPKPAWIDQPLPDVAQNERNLDNNSLAKFKDILRFASQYWGGMGALVVMAVLIVMLIFVVTNDTLYESVRNYVIASNDAFHNNHWAGFFKRVGAVLALGILVFVLYQGLLRYTKFGTERVHAWGLAFWY